LDLWIIDQFNNNVLRRPNIRFQNRGLRNGNQKRKKKNKKKKVPKDTNSESIPVIKNCKIVQFAIYFNICYILWLSIVKTTPEFETPPRPNRDNPAYYYEEYDQIISTHELLLIFIKYLSILLKIISQFAISVVC